TRSPECIVRVLVEHESRVEQYDIGPLGQTVDEPVERPAHIRSVRQRTRRVELHRDVLAWKTAVFENAWRHNGLEPRMRVEETQCPLPGPEEREQAIHERRVQHRHVATEPRLYQPD